MAPRASITFRITGVMDKCITRLMSERKLDCTSVIKLALYMLSIYMSRPDVKKKNIHQVLAEIESQAPESFPDFATFAVGRPAQRGSSDRSR